MRTNTNIEQVLQNQTQVDVIAEKHCNQQLTWEKPVAQETACGMEVNMYSPIEGDDTLF